MASTAPSCIARVTAAQATRSPRNFGKMIPSLTASDLVASAADSLQAARDRRRRFDLHDEIDRPHVDAELERRGGNERPERAGLQQIFDLDPLRRARSNRGASAPASRPRARSVRPRAARRGAGCSRISASIGAHRINSSSRGWIAVQIEGRVSPTDAGPLGMSSAVVRRAMSSTGTSMRSDRAFALSCVDDSDGTVGYRLRTSGELSRPRLRPPIPGGPCRFASARRPCRRLASAFHHALGGRRRRESAPPHRGDAAWPTVRSAAARPRQRDARRSSDSARCAPRFVGTSA